MTAEPRRAAPDLDSERETEVHEELQEEFDEMRDHEDPTTVREAFEIEAAERGLSEEAATVVDED